MKPSNIDNRCRNVVFTTSGRSKRTQKIRLRVTGNTNTLSKMADSLIFLILFCVRIQITSQRQRFVAELYQCLSISRNWINHSRYARSRFIHLTCANTGFFTGGGGGGWGGVQARRPENSLDDVFVLFCF